MLTNADVEQAIETQYALEYEEARRKDCSALLHLGLATTGCYGKVLEAACDEGPIKDGLTGKPKP